MNRTTTTVCARFFIGLMAFIAAFPAYAQQPNIGIYADETGYTCSFSGDAPGLVTAYVVFRPRVDGASGVAFAAPTPPCFGGVILTETSPFLKIGTLTTGVSIGFGSCVSGGLNVLTVTYNRAGGQTSPCCAYSIVEHPFEGDVLAVDCAFEGYSVQGLTSYFNANAQCVCSTANTPPTIPANPSPADQSTDASLVPEMSWLSSDADGDLEGFDLYLGTSPNPPLVAPGLTTASYTPAPLAPLTQYYWYVVAYDGAGHESEGPTWTFTTRAANTPPSAPANPNPSHGQIGIGRNPTLTWTANDADGDALTYDVYFGSTSPPPLAASDLAAATYTPGGLVLMTQYYWRVVASDGDDETSSPTWTFTTAMLGDVNADGQLTLADPTCAMQNTLGIFCGGNGAIERGDVNCDSYLTPRDARCIHKKVVDGSCAFCGPPFASQQQALPAHMEVGPAFGIGDQIGVRVYVSGVPSLQAFIFRLKLDPNVEFVDALRFGATSGFEGWASALFLPFPFLFNASVAGYTLGSVPANDLVGLVELRFRLTSGSSGNARIEGGFDDLVGANEVSFVVNYGPPLPVLISRFEAEPQPAGIAVSWEFSSDEPVQSFTLYRRAAADALPIAIAEGDANLTRSFTDRSVQPGMTYYYELVVRTHDGEEYRSPVKMVAAVAIALALRQNHPNPFNPSTTISFDIPGAGTTSVRLIVYDAAGRLVRTLVNEDMPGGSHSIEWNGRDERGSAASSGVYFYVLDAGTERLTRKMVLLK